MLCFLHMLYYQQTSTLSTQRKPPSQSDMHRPSSFTVTDSVLPNLSPHSFLTPSLFCAADDVFLSVLSHLVCFLLSLWLSLALSPSAFFRMRVHIPPFLPLGRFCGWVQSVGACSQSSFSLTFVWISDGNSYFFFFLYCLLLVSAPLLVTYLLSLFLLFHSRFCDTFATGLYM